MNTLTGQGIRIRVGAATDVGRVRAHNEDCYLAENLLWGVADGMGGHAAGEVASRIGVDTVGALACRHPLRPDDLLGAIRDANARILASGSTPETEGMGTTFAGLAVVEAAGADHWCVVNVGDSRVYRLIGNRMSQITHDHSEVRELLDAGLITPAEAARHPMRNIITRSLGTDPAPTPDVWVFPPSRGERFLLCTDGLTNEVGERDLMLALRTDADPQIIAEGLVDAAVRNGGRDNVTVVVVAVDTDEDDEEEADTSPRSALNPN